MKRICLLTPRHISYNPRLVKEATALTAAGYSVRVVAVSLTEERDALDEQLMKNISWTLVTVDVNRTDLLSTLSWLLAAVRQRISQLLYHLAPEIFRDVAYSRYDHELASAAVDKRADLYIAHNLQALPAAYRMARRHDSLLGFDAEDFHRGEFPEGETSLMKTLTEHVEARYLPKCDHLTAAAPGIAEAYVEALDVKKPDVILNTFSLSQRCGQTPVEELEKEKHDGTVSLYWYSQVIGPDRGLQDALRALSLLDERVHLTLRGRWADGFDSTLQRLARELGVTDRLHVLPPVPPEELVERAGQHDIGLALEQAERRNRDVCVTNKLFTYLLAGLPVVATNTLGQRGICQTLPEATRLCPIGNPAALAEAVNSFIRNKGTYGSAKTAAQEAGETTYNWEQEQLKLISSVQDILGSSQHVSESS